MEIVSKNKKTNSKKVLKNKEDLLRLGDIGKAVEIDNNPFGSVWLISGNEYKELKEENLKIKKKFSVLKDILTISLPLIFGFFIWSAYKLQANYLNNYKNIPIEFESKQRGNENV